MENDIRNSRNNYQRGVLMESGVAHNPFDEFAKWLEEARTAEVKDYNAFVLSTLRNDGFPDSRILLLRGADASGLTFFTNYQSAKGRELEHSNKVCLNFFWNTLERQVRIYGIAAKTSAEESDEYFNSRPRESRIAAWSSPQSSVLRSREELDNNVVKYHDEFEGKEVPRPPHWGGYRVVPNCFEFWQGRPSRLHDRIVFRINADGEWSTQRLAP